MICVCIHVFLSLLLLSVCSQEHAGKEFILAFCEHTRKTSIPSLTVINDNEGPVVVRISTPKAEPLKIPKVITVRDSYTMKFPKSTIQAYTSRKSLAFLIRSSKDVTVQGYNTDSTSIGGFLALPVSALGTEYVTVTHCQRWVCIVMIVGTADDTHVKVSFTIRPHNSSSCDIVFEGKRYNSGDIVALILRKYDTVQLQSACDLSGTYVSSNKPVAVFSGSDVTYVNFQLSIKGSYDNIIEQMPPITWLGRFYLIPTFPDIKRLYQLKIVPLDSSSEVTVGNDTIRLSGTPYTFRMVNKGYSVQSTSPVLVAVLMNDASYYRLPTGNIDGSISILYPVNLTRNLLNLGKTLRMRNIFPAGKTKVRLMYFLIVYDDIRGTTPVTKTTALRFVKRTEKVEREIFGKSPIHSITLWMRGRRNAAAMLPLPVTMVSPKVDARNNKFCYDTYKWSSVFLRRKFQMWDVYKHITNFMATCCPYNHGEDVI